MERLLCSLHQQRDVRAASACAVERSEVVVSQQLGVVFRTTERLDPLGRTAVTFGSPGAWDLVVGDVAKELMAERELGVVGDGRAPLPLSELSSDKRLEKPFRVGTRDAADGLERADPEDLADYRGVLQ